MRAAVQDARWQPIRNLITTPKPNLATWPTGGYGSNAVAADTVSGDTLTTTWSTPPTGGGHQRYIPTLQLAAGTVVTFQIDVLTTFAGAIWGVRFGNTLLISIPGPPVGVWARSSITFSLPAPGDQIAFRVDNLVGGTPKITAGSALSLRRPMLTLGGRSYAYADGDSAGWNWESTPGASASRGWPTPA